MQCQAPPVGWMRARQLCEAGGAALTLSTLQQREGNPYEVFVIYPEPHSQEVPEPLVGSWWCIGAACLEEDTSRIIGQILRFARTQSETDKEKKSNLVGEISLEKLRLGWVCGESWISGWKACSVSRTQWEPLTVLQDENAIVRSGSMISVFKSFYLSSASILALEYALGEEGLRVMQAHTM